jgi:hypothetical protein
MPLGHGSIAEFAVASVRGGGVVNVGSPFVSGVGFTASVDDLGSVTGTAVVAQTGSDLNSKPYYVFNRISKLIYLE